MVATYRKGARAERELIKWFSEKLIKYKVEFYI